MSESKLNEREEEDKFNDDDEQDAVAIPFIKFIPE